jgi:hypothetical protein
MPAADHHRRASLKASEDGFDPFLRGLRRVAIDREGVRNGSLVVSAEERVSIRPFGTREVAGWQKDHEPMNANPQYSLYVRRYSPFRSFGGGFEGDNRGFTTDLHVTSRTVGVATFSPRSGAPVAFAGYSTGSSWVGPGEVRKSHRLGSIGLHVGQVRVTILNGLCLPNGVSFTLHTEGNLPLKDIFFHRIIADGADKLNSKLRPGSPRPQGTPDIDTFVDFKATFSGDKALFEGVVRGDGFPNAEVFMLDTSLQVVALLDYRTKSGAAGPLHRLFGSHASNRLASFRLEIELKPDGSFRRDYKGSATVVQES